MSTRPRPAMRLTSTLILILLIHQAVAADEMVELIKDALATSRSRVRAGSCRVKVYLRDDHPRRPDAKRARRDPSLLGPTEIDASIKWLDDDYLINYAMTGEGRAALGAFGDINARSTDIVNREEHFFYVETMQTLQLYDKTKFPISHWIDLHPLRNWFNCCQPHAVDGRPWTEMLDFKMPEGTGLTATYETIINPDKTVTRVRTTSDGDILKTKAHDGLRGGASNWPIRAPKSRFPLARTL